MSTNKLNDYYPPLIIDIGTSNVKYSQPILNTCKLAKEVIKNKDKKNEDMEKCIKKEEDDIVNANTIFDYQNCIESRSVKDYLPVDDSKNDEILDFDFSKEKERKFCHEPIYGGKIYSFDSWQSIIEQIGRSKYEKNYFSQEYFSETPLIITQDSLPLSEIENQVKNIYEICFEKLKCQYVLLCNSAMINLYSQNISSGIVVDIGESRTCITPIRNGFACYDKAIRSDFFSGRTITAMMAQMENEYKNDELKILNTRITYKSYLEMDKKKKELPFCCPIDYKIETSIHKYCHINYLFSFPEIFKALYRENMKTTHDYIKNFLYYSPITNEKKFNEREEIKVFLSSEKDKQNVKTLKFPEWSNGINKIYIANKTSGNTLNEQILQSDPNYINQEELIKFRQFSLSQTIIHLYDQIIKEEAANSAKYSNIVFCGGVLNTPNLREVFKRDMESLFLSSNSSLNLYFPQIKDASCSFYKGANYLSKLNNLESLMVSRQEFYEVGAQNLGYNYI